MIRLIVIVLVLGGLGYGAKLTIDRIREAAQPEEAPEMRVDVVQARDIEEIVEASGEIRPVVETSVKSEISGRIQEIFIEEGDLVEKDQLLMRLDPANLEARLDEVERSLQADELRLERAKRNYERLRILQEKDFGRESALLDAKTDFDLALINLEIKQTRVKDAQENLAKTEIRAPHAGISIDLNLNEGSVITGASSNNSGTELLKVANLGKMYLEVNINEIDVNKLILGAPVRVRLEAVPDESIQGTVQRIAPSARRQGNRRVFPVEIAFDTTDPRIRPGISASVEIPIEKATGALSVLISAVFVEEQQSFVFIRQEDGSFVRRPVETGINDTRYVEVKEGLEDGQSVSLGRPPTELLEAS